MLRTICFRSFRSSVARYFDSSLRLPRFNSYASGFFCAPSTELVLISSEKM